MGQSRLKKLDKMGIGFAWGMVFPLLVFLTVYLARYQAVPLTEFLFQLGEMRILIKILSLCGFFNLLLFLYFYRNRLDKAARGVIAATFVYGLLVLVSRFF